MKKSTDAKSVVPPNPTPDDEEQSRRFIETAQDLGVDESGDSFVRALTAIGNAQADEQKESRHHESAKVAGKVKKD
jgi:hypothetical protein